MQHKNNTLSFVLSKLTLILLLIIFTLAVMPESVQAQVAGQSKKVFARVGKVLVTVNTTWVAGKAASCAVYAIYNYYDIHTFKCTDWRLGGVCLVPGYPAGPECPRFCNSGGWFKTGSTKEFVRNTAKDCALGTVLP